MSIILNDALANYTESLRQEHKANATVIAYTKDIDQFNEFLGQQQKTTVELVDQNDVDAFKDLLKKQRYTGKSISRKINSIKSFFRFLIANGVVAENPARVTVHPKIDNEPPRILAKLEYRALRDACRSDIRISAIVELLLQTGVRISELAALELNDVDFERDLIAIQAQNSRDSRRIPLNKAAKNSLMDYLKIRPKAREKIFFLTKTCRPFLVRNIRTAIDRYFRIAGIVSAKVNDLRHTFIIEQLKAGTPMVYVSQLVGHKRITTTEKYLKLIENSEMAPSE